MQRRYDVNDEQGGSQLEKSGCFEGNVTTAQHGRCILSATYGPNEHLVEGYTL